MYREMLRIVRYGANARINLITEIFGQFVVKEQTKELSVCCQSSVEVDKSQNILDIVLKTR